MRERPILFSGPMVRAILDGRKSQTRRVVNPQPGKFEKYEPSSPFAHADGLTWGWMNGEVSYTVNDVRCPYGKMGDRLWVRETFQIASNYHADCRDQQPPFSDGRPLLRDDDTDYPYWQQCYYAASDPCPELLCVDDDNIHQTWKPSIHMPRWASRLTLEITEVRVERLQDITEADANAEGFEREPFGTDQEGPLAATGVFANLWDFLNAKRGYGWDANPFVWVVSFRSVPS